MSDILVIGGGIIGLMTARELVAAGATVTLAEMGKTGRQASWAGGGIISPLYPWRYADSVTALARWSQAEYPKLCTALHDAIGIDPELIRSGLLILDPQEHVLALEWGERHGAVITEIDAETLHQTEPNLRPRPETALLLPEISQVRNPRLTKALRQSIEKLILIREQEEVLELLIENGRAGGAKTSKGEIRADRVVICAGAWSARLLEQHGTKPDIQPVRGQMILFYAKPGQINHVVLNQERYVIPRRDGRVLIGSTQEHTGFDKATTAEAKEELYHIAVDLFPLLKRTPIEDHWAGLRPGSPSGVPFIGMHPDCDGLYFNAGHYRNGVVTGPASARLLADLLLGRDPIIAPGPYSLDAAR